MNPFGLTPSGEVEFLAARCAAADEDAVEAFFEEGLHAGDGRAVADVDAHVENNLDLFLEDALRQAKGGNVGTHQAARPILLFEHHDLIAQGQQVVCYPKRCGPRADAGDAFAVLFLRNFRKQVCDLAAMVGGNALQTANRHRLAIHALAPAGRFAGPVARSPENRRKNVRLAVEHIRVGVTALRDEADVFRDIGVRRTGQLTVHDLMEVIRIANVCWLHELNPCMAQSFSAKHRTPD